MVAKGARAPDTLSNGNGTEYGGQCGGAGRLVLMLLTSLTCLLSLSLIFRSNLVVLPPLRSSRAEDTESLQMAQSCCFSSVSLAFLFSSVGREGSNSQHCFLCQL